MKNSSYIKLNRARYNIMFMIILSAINVYFVLSNGIINMPFSSSFSTYSAIFAKSIGDQSGDESFYRIGVLLALIVLAFYFVCYICSKTKPLFLFLSFVVFIIDTVFLIIASLFLSQFNVITIFDMILHIFTLYTLYVAIKNKQPENELEKDISREDDKHYEYRQEYVNNGGLPIISAKTNELDIFVYIDNGEALLVVNDLIYDRKEYSKDTYFELFATINDIELSFISRKNEEFLIYADKQLLNSKKRTV